MRSLPHFRPDGTQVGGLRRLTASTFTDGDHLPPAPPYDARSVANWLLDMAEQEPFRFRLRHIALQKLLYFAHGQHLVTTGQPLIAGEFEAWKFGPVHPVVYQAFKAAGRESITERATIRNLLARTETVAPVPDDPRAEQVIRTVLDKLGGLPAGRLVELSHAPRGPWRFIVDKARTEGSLGLRISDKVIVERFYQLVPLSGGEPSHGEPSEDVPLAA